MQELLGYLKQSGGGVLTRVAIKKFGKEVCQTAIDQGLRKIVHHYDQECLPLDDTGADICLSAFPEMEKAIAWKKLTIIPSGSAPYQYDTESLSYEKGVMMRLIKDWSDRRIDITIVLHQSYESPLLLWVDEP